MNQIPQLPARLCPRHGLVAGRDGRCIICHRDDAESGDRSGIRRILAVGLAGAALLGGVLVWKGVRGGQTSTVPVVTTQPALAAAPPPVADQGAQAPEPAQPDEARVAARVADEASRQRDIEAAMSRVQVRMYMVAKCELCDTARAFMKEKGIRFTEADVNADPGALAEMHKLTPGNQAPVFDVEGEVQVGFGPSTLLGAVRRAAERRHPKR
jgi:glutaredoxin